MQHALTARGPAQLGPQHWRIGNRRQLTGMRRRDQRLCIRAVASGQAAPLLRWEMRRIDVQRRNGIEWRSVGWRVQYPRNVHADGVQRHGGALAKGGQFATSDGQQPIVIPEGGVARLM